MNTEVSKPSGSARSNIQWPAGKLCAAMITVDMDGESGILFSNPEAADHLDVMAQMAYGERTGVPRLLRIFKQRGIRATFFIPGFVADRWPDAVREVIDAGHEVAHHGYLHEYLTQVPGDAAEEQILMRGIDALERLTKKRPLGYRAPGFKMRHSTPALLAKHGFLYDSSLQDTDIPYRLLVDGEAGARSIIEIPVQWQLDDWLYYMALPSLRPGIALRDPKEVVNIWADEAQALKAEGGVFNLTLHPFCSGRAARAQGIDDLIGRLMDSDEVWLTTGTELAEHVQSQPLQPFFHRPVALNESGATRQDG
uniref:polysaccharide deacetylase family protein n=1 Tax=Aminobacter niigataensis TaxID=83265 RepID=UPI002852BD41|nr:polysaccharide deacetylase [Aminobacter niigataensis]WMD00084.1 polysaccharide deacetylase [Aminobacter niigataensis]